MPAYRVTVLSPVHVGNGTVRSPSLEVVHEGGSSFVLDVEAAIRAYPDFFIRYRGGAPTPSELLAHLRDHGGQRMITVVRPQIAAQNIRVQMREGRGALLLPGSTLKGSIRTAILRAVSDQAVVQRTIRDFRPENPRFAARGLEGQMRGREHDAKYDWLRAVTVTDATFPTDSLDIVQVRVRSPRPDSLEREEDYWIACEAIRPGSTATTRILFDSFLTKESSRRELGWPPEIPFTHGWLAEVCRSRILGLLETEVHYFRERSPLPEVCQWLEAQRRDVEQAPKETIFLRLGFGIGWCGTTGEIADPYSRLEVLSRCEAAGHRIGRLPASAYDGRSKVFPKTRRYIRSSMDHPLFGFVRLDPVSDGEWPDRVHEPIRFPRPIPVRSASAGATTVETPRRRGYGIEAVLAAVRPHDVKGRFEGLLRQVEAIEDATERTAGLRGLAALVRRCVPAKDRAFYQREDVTRCLRILSEEGS